MVPRSANRSCARSRCRSRGRAKAPTSYGKSSFLIAGKFFTRLRSEDDSLVLIVGSIDERDMLLESDPEVFHITDHYRNYPAVLARRPLLEPARLRAMLERRWRAIAPKKLVKEIDGTSRKVRIR